ncbi:Trk system potassium uptake protein TrkA [Thermoflexales bacterium]|nr:Trk system potassium uptake protein TrkA [Thermoflexales bacterium]
MRVIIMGCGRVGEQLAVLMSEEGHDIAVIDYEAHALARLGPNFKGRRVRGVGFDRDVLLRAGIEEADGFAAMSSSDNANVVAARIARTIFRVPHVVARLFEPERAEVYQRLGLVTISSTTWGAERTRELLTHAELDAVRSFGTGEVQLLEIEIPERLVGHTVRDLLVPGEVAVITITRGGRALLPMSGTIFRADDVVHLAVSSDAMGRVERLLGIGEGG